MSKDAAGAADSSWAATARQSAGGMFMLMLGPQIAWHNARVAGGDEQLGANQWAAAAPEATTNS